MCRACFFRRPSAAGAIVGLLLGCLFTTAAPGHHSALLQVRVSSWDDRFRLVLDLSAETDCKHRVLSEPDRIAINLSKTTAESLVLPEVDEWMVKRVRFNRLKGPTAQIVLDLAQEPSFDVFTLPAAGGKPFRVVCDVYRRIGNDTGESDGTWVIVIDPGHGGKDPGAVNRRYGLKEKEVVLDVAQRLRRVLNGAEGVEARLTREKDIFLGLRERVAGARSLGGDAFVSIHVNGCLQRSARGAEVFFLSLKGATNAASKELEALENAADVPQDPMLAEIADLPFAVDLLQTDTILRSSLLAEAVLDALDDSRLAATRGVKQANFTVLRSCRLPSALIELGFVSNPDDARRLGSPSHRQALAETIAKGLLEYRRRYARHSEGSTGLDND